MDRLIKRYTFLIKPTLIVSGIILIAILAILRADFNYVDDMGRVARGYTGWNGSSRYLTTFLAHILHMDYYLTDISPMPQLIAVIVLGLSCAIVMHIVLDKTTFSIWECIAVFPVALNPFFLECISYKYDSPYMALSILASFFPLLFMGYKRVVYILAAFLCTLIVCTTYQASTTLFPMAVVLIFLMRWNKGEEYRSLLRFIVDSISGYGVAVLFFKFSMMKEFGEYYIPPIKDLPLVVTNNFYNYFSLVIRYYKKEWLLLSVIIVMTAIIVSVMESERSKWLSLIMSIVSVVIMSLMSFGLNPLFAGPPLAPRILFGFGILVGLFSVRNFTCKKAYPGKLAALALTWCFFSFSFTYGNALNVQKQYTDFRITQAIDDIKDSEAMIEYDSTKLQIIGSIGYAKAIENMPEDFELIRRLVPVTFQGPDWHWGYVGIENYYGLKFERVDRNEEDFKKLNMKVISDNAYHRISFLEDKLLIELK